MGWKKLTLLCSMICAITLTACGAIENNTGTVSGLVVMGGGMPVCFVVESKNGKNYGFVVNEDTEIVWEDKSAFTIWEDSPHEYDDWDVFGCCMQVDVVPGEKTEVGDDYEEVENWRYAEKVVVTKVEDEYFVTSAKPVIYLYPEQKEEVSVKLEYDGKLTCTYPEYDNGWKVTAFPDGRLMDEEGILYNYLYWEGDTHTEYDFSEGFCVAGEDTAKFLEDALAKLGLTRREANEFIVYWLPMMEQNAYNLISFQQEAYTDHAKLVVSPEPETMIRVFMAWKPLEEAIEIQEQELDAPKRTGFTVVEWGGCKVE